MCDRSGPVGDYAGWWVVPRKAETSAKAERDQLRERMHGYGCTIPQIAAEMARRFNLRPRVAWRHALGWPQWKVAQRYNVLHPGARLSDHRVSEFEVWPHGGCPPSLRYLARLAVTFGHGCTPAQLVDADDLEQLTPADRCLLTAAQPLPAEAPGTRAAGHRSTKAIVPAVGHATSALILPTEAAMGAVVLPLPGELAPLLMSCLELLTAADGAELTTPGGHDQAYHRLVQFFTSWAHTMKKRRDVLRTLGWAATAASVGYFPDPDERARLAAVLSKARRIDTHTIEHFQIVLRCCARQDDALGPRGVLDTVLAQRSLLRSLLPDCPAALRPRLLSTLGNASRMAGWLCFDVNDFPSAGYFYEDARAQAHEADNVELGAHVLRNMSHLAIWQDRPRTGIDHAVAANQWAQRTGDRRLQAYCADGAAVAYACDGQRSRCLTALDAARVAVGRIGEQPPGFLYSYDEATHIMHRGLCHLKLGDAHLATDCAQQSLTTLDKSKTRNVAMTIMDLSSASVQAGEIDEAARLLGDAGEIAASNSSTRLVGMVKQTRAALQPWQDSSAVRELDDRLAAYGLV